MRKYFDLVRPELVSIFSEALSQKPCKGNSKKSDSQNCYENDRCMIFFNFCASLIFKTSILTLLFCSFVIISLYSIRCGRLIRETDNGRVTGTVEGANVPTDAAGQDKSLCLIWQNRIQLSLKDGTTRECVINILFDSKGCVYLLGISHTGGTRCVNGNLASGQSVGYRVFHEVGQPLSHPEESP